jgi:hypothetical protein
MLDGQVWQPEDYGKDVEVTISDAADAGGKDDISILHVKASVSDGEGKLSEGALAAALKGLADGSVGKENLSTDKNANGLSFRTSSFSLYLAEMKNSGQSVLLVSNSKNTGDGEAEAEQNGIVLKGEGSFDILVTGTLETEGTPVLISESVTPKNVSITVWKIDGAVKDAEGEEHVVAEGTPGTEPKTITDDSREVERSIHYIIRVEPSQQDMIGLSGTEEVHGYDLSFTLDQIRPSYEFDESCQGCVPQAIVAFLESTSFEDAIRNAVSIGGDSDTIAAITGSIAQGRYGVPVDLAEEVERRLPEDLRAVVGRFCNRFIN